MVHGMIDYSPRYGIGWKRFSDKRRFWQKPFKTSKAISHLISCFSFCCWFFIGNIANNWQGAEITGTDHILCILGGSRRHPVAWSRVCGVLIWCHYFVRENLEGRLFPKCKSQIQDTCEGERISKSSESPVIRPISQVMSHFWSVSPFSKASSYYWHGLISETWLVLLWGTDQQITHSFVHTEGGDWDFMNLPSSPHPNSGTVTDVPY